MDDAVRKYGQPKHVVCSLPDIDFPPVRERQHGEVCMAILRRNGRFLMQTKESYPDSVMRLPSGGIKSGEAVEHALLREVWEETNLTVNVQKFVALLSYRSEEIRSPFKTHLFLLQELDGEFRNNDPSEKISAWCEVAPKDLPDYADALDRLQPDWKNWGTFRAASIRTLDEYCRQIQL